MLQTQIAVFPEGGALQLEVRKQVSSKRCPGEKTPLHRIPSASPWWEGQAWCTQRGPLSLPFLSRGFCASEQKLTSLGDQSFPPLWSPVVNGDSGTP